MDLLQTFFNWNVLVESLPLMIRGLGVTVLLGLVSIVLGLVGGLLLALLRLYSYAPVRLLARIYIDIMRSIPLLVLLVLIYYALPFVGIRLSSFAAAASALSLVSCAYSAEIFRVAYLLDRIRHRAHGQDRCPFQPIGILATRGHHPRVVALHQGGLEARVFGQWFEKNRREHNLNIDAAEVHVLEARRRFEQRLAVQRKRL